MLSGTFPTRLKYAIVKPLLKKEDKENVANYRPISLLTSFSKVLEKIIYDRLLKHIETNNFNFNFIHVPLNLYSYRACPY